MIQPLIRASTRHIIASHRPTSTRSLHLARTTPMPYSCFPWSKKHTTAALRTFSDDQPRYTQNPPAYSRSEKPSSRMPAVATRGFATTAHKQEVNAFKLGLPIEEAKLRLNKLQALLVEHKLDYYIVGTADEHLSEWTASTDQRREWISGFSGSAGTAIIARSSQDNTTADVKGDASAWLFVDNRYWIQAEGQTSKELWEVVRVVPKDSPGITSPWEWCKKHVDEGARIGIDPKLIDWPTAQSIQKTLRTKNISLLGITENLIDTVRESDVPPYSKTMLEDHPLVFSGQPTSEKLSNIRRSLFGEDRDQDPENHGGIYVLPVLPAVAWLLNLRCQGDIPNVPVFRSYLALTPSRVCLFIDQEKLNEEVKQRLKADGVEWRDYGVEEVKRWVLEHRIRVREESGEKALEVEGRVLVPTSASWGLADAIGLDNVKTIDCPVDAAKAIKNATEIEGFRRAYLRDGAATARWLAWLEEEVKDKKMDIGECDAGDKLTAFRSLEQYYRGLAYDNISASGPNGALPHYIPHKGQDRIIDRETTYVIDAGGQYLDGTIDTTRTLHFGNPTPDQTRAFTRVLQGHIAIETTPFPQGTKGDKLDPLARQFLWREGLNFGHGVGHGIGSYLSVHELPPGIGWATTIKPGHIVSNEPGFYLEGEWGIRIESVVVCKEVETRYAFGQAPWLCWERVTRVPIQASLVDFTLLSKEEAQWLKDHNDLCIKEVMPLLNRTGDEKARKWLKKQAL